MLLTILVTLLFIVGVGFAFLSLALSFAASRAELRGESEKAGDLRSQAATIRTGAFIGSSLILLAAIAVAFLGS